MPSDRPDRSPGAPRRRSRAGLAAALCLLVGLPVLLRAAAPVAGQGSETAATPGASPVASPPAAASDRLDLAAIALDADDLPDGYVLRSESYATGAAWAAQTFAGDRRARRTIADAGLEWWYESTYGLAGSLLTIRTYVEQYADEAGARAGFAFLEDESITLPSRISAEDFPIEGVESDPEELSIVDWEVAPGVHYRSVDATIRDGRVVAGVAMESIGGTVPPERAVVEELAVVLAGRVADVLAAGRFAEPALAAALLPAGDATVTLEGYLAGAEVVPPTLPAVAAGFAGGYVRTVGLPFPTSPDATQSGTGSPPPTLFVSLAVLRFDAADEAHAALYALDDLTVPTPLPPPAESFRQQGEPPEVHGADRVRVSRRALLPGGPVDSVRLGFVAGDDLALVEVAGAASLAAAEEAASLLANLQAACLAGGDLCATPLPAAELQAAALETAPVPAPVAGDAGRAEIFDRVWRTINDAYLYRTGRQGILFANYHDVDWNAVRAEYEPRALAAESDEAFYRIVAEMVEELGDQHTGYLSPAEARADDALFAGEPVYVGIGALLARGLDPANPGLVLYVFPDSPAERAGLQRRDSILAVDGEAIATADDERAVELLDAVDTLTSPDQAGGDPGGPVRLTVASPGQPPREVEARRSVGPAAISPVVERLPSDPSIAYVLVIDFVTPDLNDQLVAGLEALLADGPLDGLILDLRANPGGSLGVTQQVLGQFVSGEVGAFYNRDGTPPEPFNVEPGELAEELADVPVVVLTDDRMYSASEVTTAVLQNEGRATVVGVSSPGDVEVLIPVGFPDGSRLYLAVQLFDLPGRIVEGQGVVPDVPVAEDWTRFPFAEDPQIRAAVGIIGAAALESGDPRATPEP